VLGLDAESGEVDSAGPAFLRASLRPRLRFIVVLRCFLVAAKQQPRRLGSTDAAKERAANKRGGEASVRAQIAPRRRLGIPRNGMIMDRLADKPTEAKRSEELGFLTGGEEKRNSVPGPRRSRTGARPAAAGGGRARGTRGAREGNGCGGRAGGGGGGDGGGGRAREPKLVRWHTAGRPGGTQVSE